ncbi:MAG: hypothetical protein H0T89_28230 [Deltaproteobacteria bacterium]|nr:hypothetical protein [Deltaproteobacteria bacterium]MDQ3299072.1 hypothetical protein [Myxococcota bacterium]
MFRGCLALVIGIGIGACGPKAGPVKPRVDTARLARALHDDLLELGAIARRHRGDCATLVPALRPHVEVMRAHAGEVKAALEDPAIARQLRADVRAYDAEHRGVADAIGEDLGASYVTCKDNAELPDLIDRIPEL